jgi:hypothetical protein
MVKPWVAILAVISLLFLTASQPANVIGVPNTVTTTNINTSSSGNLLLVSHSGTLSVYVTHFHIFLAGTSNVSLVYGTTSSTPCDTGTTTLDGPMAFIAQTGIQYGTGLGAVLAVPSGKDLCLDNGSASQVGGAISWAYGQ